MIGGQPRTLISERGRKYAAAVAATVLRFRLGLRLSGRLSVVCETHQPRAGKVDLDNLGKAMLDSLTKAGVWLDDSQIDILTYRRGSIVRGGSVVLTIFTLSETKDSL